MALSSKILIFIICGLEMIWYFYGIGLSWFGIGNAYYLYVMRLTLDPFSWSDFSSYCIGIIVYVLSAWSTMALFYVAITDGDCSCKFENKYY
jgi:hypothetical protein